jgi:nitrite reductase/ring-hydroxylating ferredoxin subunit
MRFQPLEKLFNLNDHYSRQFKIDHLHLLLIQRPAGLFLIEANCPHRGHPLSDARISGDVIECPLHHYQFSLQDGRLQRATEETCRGLRTYDLVYKGSEVGLMLED